MISVNRALCAYCGSCVSICPVAAITLAETRLLINEACTECGKCIAACPVGALSDDNKTAPTIAGFAPPLASRYDVVVVGAGPGGSYAALTAARQGLSVLLLEKRQEIGSPVRCAEGVPAAPFEALITPPPQWVAAEVSSAEIVAVAGTRTITRTGEGGRGYVLERRVFDRALAAEAARAGATVRVKTAATALLIENNVVRGVKIETAGLASADVEAALVISADGVESLVGRWAGIDTRLPLADTLVCAQYLLAGIDLDPARTYYYLGSALAPGGYAWIFPKGADRANVGLGVRADLGQYPAVTYLNRFIAERPFLAQGSPVSLIAGAVPAALPPERLVTDGLMLIGDAARQVDPLTGGGIINAMTAGQYAAEVAVQAIAAGDTSAAFLQQYAARWARTRGRKMARNYRLRAQFSPAEFASEKLVRLFAVAVGS